MLRCDGRKAPGLVLDRLDDLGVLMADVDVDQLGGEVQKTIAVVVPDVAALTSGDDHGLQRLLRAPRVKDVLAVQVVNALALGGIGIHGGSCRDGCISLEPRIVHHKEGRPAVKPNALPVPYD